MKKGILYIIFSLFLLPAFCQYKLVGGNKEPYKENQSNIFDVYLLDGLENAKISFSSDAILSAQHQWYKYQSRAIEAIPVVSYIEDGNTSYITDIEDGYGYFVGSTNNPNTNYIWVIDYSLYVPTLRSFSFIEEENDDEEDIMAGKCKAIRLQINADVKLLNFRNPSGVYDELDRTFPITFDNLVWKDEQFIQEQGKIIYRGIGNEILWDAPLINTRFTLNTDSYSEYFGYEQKLETDLYEAKTFEVYSFAYIMNKNGEEERYTPDDNPLPAESAPITIRLEAHCNELPGTMYEWLINKMDGETSNTIRRYTDANCETVIDESGVYQIILGISSLNSTCEYKSVPYEYSIYIEESTLILPNAFTPGSSIGMNDVYKVKYKSLVKFKATIFNRWGNLIYQWDDPEQGWDGTVAGKYVPTGVYYIVVDAQGADGKRYKKSSDINILRSRN